MKSSLKLFLSLRLTQLDFHNLNKISKINRLILLILPVLLNLSQQLFNLIRLRLKTESPQSHLQLRSIHKTTSFRIEQIKSNPQLLNMIRTQLLTHVLLKLWLLKFLLH